MSFAALRADRRVLELSGPDRVRFLNGMVTNDVTLLQPGQGCLAVKTSAKGRVEAYVRVRAAQDVLFVDAVEAVAAKLLSTLEQFILMDDVNVRAVPCDTLVVLGELSGFGALDLEDHAFVERDGITIIRDRTLGAPGFELQTKPGEGAALLDRILKTGATHVSAETLDILRVENGVPIDGKDLAEDTLPMEANLQQAISYTKGCYIGQEVIARGTNLGGVNYSLVGLRFDAQPNGEELIDGDKRIGEVTSVVLSTRFGWIGLGYVRKTHEAEGTKISLKTGQQATVAALPFHDSRPLFT